MTHRAADGGTDLGSERSKQPAIAAHAPLIRRRQTVFVTNPETEVSSEDLDSTCVPSYDLLESGLLALGRCAHQAEFHDK